MSERDEYPHGVPCWVEALVPDPRAATAFYAEVFGWEFTGPGKMPDEPSSDYFVARLRGRDVAGIGLLPRDAPAPSWITHVRTDSADETAKAAVAAGGAVVVEPFDVPPVGRMAVLDDPAGARFCAWQAGGREGAEIVNEPSAWAMSGLHTPDPERSQDFYRAVFGWEPEPFGPIWLFRLPGFVGGEPSQPVPRDVVATMFPADGGDAFWQPDFWIADVDGAAAAAGARGGSVIEPPAEFEGAPFRSAVLADPDGASFSLSQLIA
jgi:predicted enzyme related to lactoylglutathione lyase